MIILTFNCVLALIETNMIVFLLRFSVFEYTGNCHTITFAEGMNYLIT